MTFIRLSENETTTVNLPRHVEDTLVFRNSFYVVTNGEKFAYFPIKVIPASDDSPLFRMERLPPVMLEGYAMINKRMYRVPLQDLQRRIIRKSREVIRDSKNDTNDKSVSTLLNSEQPTLIPGIDHSGFSEAAELEIIKAANATWEDQVGTLYSDPFEEEDEWEVQNDS